MRELLKSLFRFAWATSLFGARQLTSGLAGKDNFDSVAGIAAARLSGGLKTLHDAGQRMQSEVVDTAFAATNPSLPSASTKRIPVNSGRLNTSRFVVLGEGLAAGMGNFSLNSDSQRTSFPAQMAQQMGVDFAQPLMQPPGIGEAAGFETLPVIVPGPLQSTVLNQIPPPIPDNLSIPGYTVADAVERRPSEPLIDRENSKQTAANLILGVRSLAYGLRVPLPTQLECALERKPTFALVALGISETIDAAVSGDIGRLPTREAFRKHYAKLIGELRLAGAEVLALTIPDPTVSAYYSDLQTAGNIVKVDAVVLAELWQLAPDDLISANGLNELSFQILDKAIKPLKPSDRLAGATAAAIRERIYELNRVIVDIAQAEGARSFNLACYLKKVAEAGIAVGSRMLSAAYMGGFYSLNGYYPGATGQALIANEVLALLNREFGAAFPMVDVSVVMAADPIAAYKHAAGPNWKRTQLEAFRDAAPAIAIPQSPASTFRPTGPRTLPLKLPAGLEQVLPLNSATSYFGDGIAALNSNDPRTIPYGSGGNLLFGGLAMVDTHLTGNVRIKFSPPVNGCTRFQMSFEGGLKGDNQVLAAPQFFKMPFRENGVTDMPGLISSGTLNLNTGEVDTSRGALIIYAKYSSTALNALIKLNPTFPSPLSFPGQYGSACLVFEQRPDGKLDFTFAGTTFVPLGPNIAWPLNFVGPSNEYATIPANGTVMHPHLALSTVTTESVQEEGHCDLPPCNKLHEYTLFTPASSFGDVFTLNSPQLGGPATGRSRLLGRLQIQLGPRCGHTVPVAISSSVSGGLLAPMDASPLDQIFPGRLTPGPLGFYENLRFPLRTYSLNDVAIIDDPFDLSVGALDLRTGKLVHPLLHRGFINQDLIFSLLRVEPCTPQNSFLFRGPGEFRPGRVFEYYGQVHIPYPPGFLFPDPNLATGFPIGPASALDPYLWFLAVSDDGASKPVSGEGLATSTKAETFSYRYHIPSRSSGGRAEFEYINQTQNGNFQMHSLTWIGQTTTSTDSGQFDVLTFTGFGVWSKDGVERVEQAAVQVCTSAKLRYVGIQVGLADISNVNTVIAPEFFRLRKPEPGGYVCCVGVPSQPLPPPPPPKPCPPAPPCGTVMPGPITGSGTDSMGIHAMR